MCNRYVISDEELIYDHATKLAYARIEKEMLKIERNYNVTPTTMVPVLFDDGQPAARLMRWGVRGSFPGAPLVLNARSDKILASRFWKKSTETRRCLMLANGFFDFEKLPDGARQGYYFTVKDSPAICFAAVWMPGEDGIPTCAMVTREPNELVLAVHDRMPVMLDDKKALEWVGREPMPEKRIFELCAPLAPERMGSWPVTRRMNHVNYRGADAIEPIKLEPKTIVSSAPPETQGDLFGGGA